MSDDSMKPPPIWRLDGLQVLLTAGALLNAMAFFSALPFASIYLSSHTPLSVAAIGLVIGLIALIASIGGVLGGILIDRFDTVLMMIVGLAGYVGIYAALMTVSDTGAIVTLFLGLGAARTLIEPGGKKLMSLADDGEGRIFRVRYMVLCFGAIVGPAIGGLLYSVSTTMFFAVPGMFYIGYLLLILLCRKRLSALDRTGDDTGPRFPLSGALRDRRLVLATGAGLAIFFVFSQLESMIPLYMEAEWGENAVRYFAGLFIVNAVLALLFQVPIVWLSKHMAHNRLILVGCAGFALSFLCFFASGSYGLWMMYAGIVLWTVGEGVLLPMPDIAVHQIAVGNRKGTYFGIAEVRYLGFFAGPFVGGLLLADNALYFAVMTLAVFICVPQLKTRRPTEPNGTQTEVSVNAQT
jgi:MFS family permease